MTALPGLTTEVLGRHCEHHAVLSSTNTYLKERASSLPHGAAVIADSQTEGKGRRGKRWENTPGDALYLSILLRDWSPVQAAPLPLVAGLAVSEALASFGVACDLKWSNDVLVGDKKICGILCESRIQGKQSTVIMGLGINSNQLPQDFTRLHLVYATSLRMVTGKQYTSPTLAAAVLNALEPMLRQCREQGFSGDLRDRYRRRCVTLGREVRLQDAGGEKCGKAVDIAPDGALLCEIDGVLLPVTAGEVSVRGLNGYV